MIAETPTPISATDIYKRLLTYDKPYWSVFVISIIGMIFFAATETGLAAMMKPLMDGSFVNRDADTIKFIPLALIALFIVRDITSK